MATPSKALLIPTSGPVEEVELDGTLKQLRALVGGDIEAVPMPEFLSGADRATAYVHEEGKLIGADPNMRATDFMVPGVGLMWGDYIAGTFLICGFDPNLGETGGELPEPVVARVRLIEREAA